MNSHKITTLHAQPHTHPSMNYLHNSPSPPSSSPCACPCICLCCHLCASSFPSPCLCVFCQRTLCDRQSLKKQKKRSSQEILTFTIHWWKYKVLRWYVLSILSRPHHKSKIYECWKCTTYLLPCFDFSRSLSFLWSLCLCSLSLYLSLCL